MSNSDLEIVQASQDSCTVENLRRQLACLAELPFFKQGLDATDSMILVLNSCRQAVFANKKFLVLVQKTDESEILGKYPGDIICCVNAKSSYCGCGTAEACKYCGAAHTIWKSISNFEKYSNQFSNINTMHGYEQHMNLGIHVAPLELQGEKFFVVSLTDNSDSVRKRLLERTFFHDIMNTVGALKGIVKLLKDDVPEEIKAEVEFVEGSFNALVEEIEGQKDMMDAEDKQLVLHVATIQTVMEWQSIIKLYEQHEIAKHKTIILDTQCNNLPLQTDQRLLRRILGNMLKNALEASQNGDIVTCGCHMEVNKNWVSLWVHNNQYMDERVQSLVFHRSFSTKGSGRGLGTFSMKLFGEILLKGKVGFYTKPDQGTWFYIKLPLLQVIGT